MGMMNCPMSKDMEDDIGEDDMPRRRGPENRPEKKEFGNPFLPTVSWLGYCDLVLPRLERQESVPFIEERLASMLVA